MKATKKNFRELCGKLATRLEYVFKNTDSRVLECEKNCAILKVTFKSAFINEIDITNEIGLFFASNKISGTVNQDNKDFIILIH